MSTSKPQLRYFALTLTLIWIVYLVGCASSIQYDSQCERAALLQLQGKKVLLLQFDHANNMIVGDSSLDASASNVVADAQKAELLKLFGQAFNMKDVSAQYRSIPNGAGQINPSDFARRVLQNLNADGGLIVTNSYAYQMASGSIKDIFVVSVLKRILPDQWIGSLIGTSQIQAYDFASNAVLYNRQGKVVWSFYGKASAMPKLAQLFAPTTIMRSAAGLDPSSQNLAKAIYYVSEKYMEYLYWAMQQDLIGSGKKNYFTDYPADRKDGYISIFPADDTRHSPFVRGYDPMPE